MDHCRMGDGIWGNGRPGRIRHQHRFRFAGRHPGAVQPPAIWHWTIGALGVGSARQAPRDLKLTGHLNASNTPGFPGHHLAPSSSSAKRLPMRLQINLSVSKYRREFFDAIGGAAFSEFVRKILRVIVGKFHKISEFLTDHFEASRHRWVESRRSLENISGHYRKGK